MPGRNNRTTASLSLSLRSNDFFSQSRGLSLLPSLLPSLTMAKRHYLSDHSPRVSKGDYDRFNIEAILESLEANVCFNNIATDPLVISSLELIHIDPTSYDLVLSGNDSSVLLNYDRLSFDSIYLFVLFTEFDGQARESLTYSSKKEEERAMHIRCSTKCM